MTLSMSDVTVLYFVDYTFSFNKLKYLMLNWKSKTVHEASTLPLLCNVRSHLLQNYIMFLGTTMYNSRFTFNRRRKNLLFLFVFYNIVNVIVII